MSAHHIENDLNGGNIIFHGLQAFIDLFNAHAVAGELSGGFLLVKRTEDIVPRENRGRRAVEQNHIQSFCLKAIEAVIDESADGFGCVVFRNMRV